MSRFFQILLVACLAIALCAAEAPRYRSRNGRLQLSKQRSRFLARQEAAEEAGVTPYPSAKELIPEIPFAEGAAADAPELTFAPEAPVAPVEDDINVSVNVDLPAEQEPVEEEVDEAAAADDAESEHEPDLIYGPPEAEDVPAVNEITPEEEIETTIAEEEERAAAEEELQSGRLISSRRFNSRRVAARPAKLRAATPARGRTASIKSARIVKAKVTKARSARLQQLPQQQQFFVPQQFAAQQQQPMFYYSAAQLQQW